MGNICCCNIFTIFTVISWSHHSNMTTIKPEWCVIHASKSDLVTNYNKYRHHFIGQC